jgi:hypothetical protein
MFDGEIEDGTVGTGLSAGKGFLNHDDRLHCALTRVESEIMKAVTLRPTWAWFVVKCYIDIKNRSWPTRLRGRIWIHAGSGPVTKADQFDFILNRVMEQAVALYSDWPMAV